MPGHPIPTSSVEQAKKGVTTLEELFVKHDVILLPMDCQELCWPSTVLGATKGKIVPNVALGFDTFIVMRHGAWIPNTKGNRLRCYYYNDIVAPTYVSFRGNVLTDDRQLTSCGNPSRIGHSTRCRDMRVKTRPPDPLGLTPGSDQTSSRRPPVSTPNLPRRPPAKSGALGRPSQDSTCLRGPTLMWPWLDLGSDPAEHIPDQMCTATRPGLASIAASMAVKLLVSTLQQPEGYVIKMRRAQ